MRKEKMTKEEVEKKKKRIIKIFFAIVIIIVLLIGAYIANDFIIMDNNKTTNLVINNKNVTSYLKKGVLIEDDNIYISKQDISNFFDKYIYEDKENNQIVTTYDKKIATIGFDSNTININGSEKKIYAHALKKDDSIYLPISEMQDVYGIEIKKIDESNVITIDSTNREQKKAIVSGGSAIKATTKFIAKTLDRVNKGDYVIIVEENDNGWSKVRTAKGKVGYIKSNKLANEITVRENMENESQINGKVNLVWDYFSEYASAPDRSGTTIDGVNVVSPAFFYLDNKGKVQANVGTKGEEYIKWAHENNYKVWPMISNAGDGMLTVTSNIMNDYNKRQELIEQIVNMCVKYDVDGINIDFENMKKDDINLYSRFIIELTPRIKEAGLTISVDVTAPDGGDTWSLCFDRNVIGDVADYIVFMAYDEYGTTSSKAGTTAGYDWVEISLKKFLETEEIESNKIILAIPFYTNLWTIDASGKASAKVVNMKDIDKVLPQNVEKQWKDDVKQNYVEYTEGTSTKKMWIEDLKSIKEKISLITKYNLAGLAAWEKDREDSNVWSLIKQELNN